MHDETYFCTPFFYILSLEFYFISCASGPHTRSGIPVAASTDWLIVTHGSVNNSAQTSPPHNYNLDLSRTHHPCNVQQAMHYPQPTVMHCAMQNSSILRR